jgi:hypothetical protein
MSDADTQAALERAVAPAKALAALFDTMSAAGPATQWLFSLRFEDGVPVKPRPTTLHPIDAAELQEGEDVRAAFQDFLSTLSEAEATAYCILDYDEAGHPLPFLASTLSGLLTDTHKVALRFPDFPGKPAWWVVVAWWWQEVKGCAPQDWPAFVQWEREHQEPER